MRAHNRAALKPHTGLSFNANYTCALVHTSSLSIWRFGLFYFLTLYLSLLLAVLLLYSQYKLSCEVVLHLSDAVFVGVQLVTRWLRGKLMICSGFVLYNARLMDWINELSHHDDDCEAAPTSMISCFYFHFKCVTHGSKLWSA